MITYFKKHLGLILGLTAAAMIATSLLSHLYRLERLRNPPCKNDESLECAYDGADHPRSYYGYHFGAPLLFYGERTEEWLEARRRNIALENVRRFDAAAFALDLLIHFAVAATIPLFLHRTRRRSS